MRLIHLLSIVLVLVGLACASRKGEVVRVVEFEVPEQSTWIGRTGADLEQQWGRPSETQSDSEGGTVWVYTRVLGEYVAGSHFPTTPGYAPYYPAQVNPDYPPKTYHRTTEAAKFWIAEDGVIYRVWVHPKHALKMRKPATPQESDSEP